MTNYNKQINKSNLKGFSNITAYPEFFTWCEEHNLTFTETRILQYIFCNSKNWEISPSKIGKDWYKENFNETKRSSIKRSLSSLLNKLKDYIILPNNRSKGGNGKGGTIVDATKAYDEIFNLINSTSEEKLIEDNNKTTIVEPITEQLLVELDKIEEEVSVHNNEMKYNEALDIVFKSFQSNMTNYINQLKRSGLEYQYATEDLLIYSNSQIKLFEEQCGKFIEVIINELPNRWADYFLELFQKYISNIRYPKDFYNEQLITQFKVA